MFYVFLGFLGFFEPGAGAVVGAVPAGSVGDGEPDGRDVRTPRGSRVVLPVADVLVRRDPGHIGPVLAPVSFQDLSAAVLG